MGIGSRIKDLLKEEKMTIKALSEKTNISVNTLYSITKRDDQNVRSDNLEKIADALDVTVDYLTTGELPNLSEGLRKPLEDAKRIRTSLPTEINDVFNRHGLTSITYNMMIHDYNKFLGKHGFTHAKIQYLFADLQDAVLQITEREFDHGEEEKPER